MRKTSFAAILLLVTGGCGSTGEPGLTPRSPVERTVMVTTADGAVGDVRLVQEDHLRRDQVAASADRVLAALPGIFTDLGLPEPEVDAARRLVVVQPYNATRRVGDMRMSQILDCGRGPAGFYADQYRIRLSVLTQVRPDDSSYSTLMTRITATGQNTGGTSGNVPCTTQGKLEDAISSAVHEAMR